MMLRSEINRGCADTSGSPPGRRATQSRDGKAQTPNPVSHGIVTAAEAGLRPDSPPWLQGAPENSMFNETGDSSPAANRDSV